MPVRWYLLPVESPDGLHWGPKYLKWRFNPDGLDVARAQHMRFGKQRVLLSRVDATDAQHAELAAHADAFQIPSVIRQADLNRFKRLAEALGIPLDYLSQNSTDVEVVRLLARAAQFYQAVAGSGAGEVVAAGESIDDAPSPRLTAVLGRPKYAFLGDASSVRDLVSRAVAAWGNDPLEQGGIEL